MINVFFKLKQKHFIKSESFLLIRIKYYFFGLFKF